MELELKRKDEELQVLMKNLAQQKQNQTTDKM